MMASVTMCNACAEAAENKATASTREEKAKARWKACVPKQYRDTDVHHPSYQAMMLTHKAAMMWLRGSDLEQGERRLFLGLVGESGHCKTRIISQLVKRMIWEGDNILWMNSSNFQWACQNQFNDLNAREASAWLHRYQIAPVLVFDDIGNLRSTEVVSDALYRLLEHRTSNCLPMLWTSNETISEMLAGKNLTEKARKRNLSRLAGYSNILEI